MKIHYKGYLFDFPKTDFLIKYYKDIKNSYLISGFFAELRKASDKPKISAKDFVDKGLPLALLPYFDLQGEKHHIFSQLLAPIQKETDVPESAIAALAALGFSHAQVLEQIPQLTGRPASAINYRDLGYNYYGAAEHCKSLTWLQQIAKIVDKRENGQPVENFFIINHLSLFRPIEIDENQFMDHIRKFPNHETLTENLLSLALARRINFISDDFIAKVLAFYNGLPLDNPHRELQFNLDLSLARYICKLGNENQILDFMRQRPLGLFEIWELARNISLNSKVYKDLILPLAHKDFDIFVEFFLEDDMAKHAPISLLLHGLLEHISQGQWKSSYKLARLLALPEMDLNLNALCEQTLLPAFLQGSFDIKCRLLPFFANTPELHPSLLKELDRGPLPSALSKENASYIFNHLNQEKSDPQKAASRCRAILTHLEGLSQQTSKKNHQSVFSALEFSGNHINFNTYGLQNKVELQEFCRKHPLFLKHCRTQMNFKRILGNPSDFFQVLSEFFDDKELNSLFFASYAGRFPELSLEEVREIETLHKQNQIHLGTWGLQNIATDLHHKDHWSQLFSHDSELHQVFQRNHQFWKDLTTESLPEK